MVREYKMTPEQANIVHEMARDSIERTKETLGNSVNDGNYESANASLQHLVNLAAIFKLTDVYQHNRADGNYKVLDVQQAIPVDIPSKVYYSTASNNFYACESALGMGDHFYKKWANFAAHFPQSREEAQHLAKRGPGNPWITTSTVSGAAPAQPEGPPSPDDIGKAMDRSTRAARAAGMIE